MADSKVADAVEIVARRAIWMAVANFLDNEPWGDIFPEIGEHDWIMVEARMASITGLADPHPDEYQAAYEFLESRAEK